MRTGEVGDYDRGRSFYATRFEKQAFERANLPSLAVELDNTNQPRSGANKSIRADDRNHDHHPTALVDGRPK